MDCVFCEIFAGTSPASFVYRDEVCAAFMDVVPVNPGHVPVVPNRHAMHLSDLEPQEGGRMFDAGRGVAAALCAGDTRCEGVNLFLTDGEVAVQEVFHTHLHVIPRFAGDGFGIEYGNSPERLDFDGLAKSIGGNP